MTLSTVTPIIVSRVASSAPPGEGIPLPTVVISTFSSPSSKLLIGDESPPLKCAAPRRWASIGGVRGICGVRRRHVLCSAAFAPLGVLTCHNTITQSSATLSAYYY